MKKYTKPVIDSEILADVLADSDPALQNVFENLASTDMTEGASFDTLFGN